MFPRITRFFSLGGSALLALALTALTAVPAYAQGNPGPPLSDSILTYHFSGARGNEATFAPSRRAALLASSPIRRGSGLTPAAGAGAFAASGWSQTAGSIDTADYFAFSLRSYVGFGVVIATLRLRERRSDSGIRHWELRSSLDGFAAPVSSTAVPTTTQLASRRLI